MKKLILILLFAFALMAVFFLLTRGKGGAGLNPGKTSEQKTEANVGAGELFTAFAEDEAGANERYLNKVIAVTGVVATVATNDRRGASVTLKSDEDPKAGIKCKLDLRQVGNKSDFKIGETVTLKGVCTGLVRDVELVDCTEL